VRRSAAPPATKSSAAAFALHKNSHLHLLPQEQQMKFLAQNSRDQKLLIRQIDAKIHTISRP
jgi:hypothetical protein